jgi:hypothetical protein
MRRAKKQPAPEKLKGKKLFAYVKYYWSKLPVPECKQRAVSKGTTI